jgi:hypothetical protein
LYIGVLITPMEFQSNISRINWRQLLVHFIAGVFFVYAFTTFSYLYDTRFVVAYRIGYVEAGSIFTAHGVTIPDLMNFAFLVTVSGILGSLAAFIISMKISLKRGWFWVNPVIILTATYILSKFTSLTARLPKPIHGLISLATGDPILETAIYGVLLLAVGTFIFFYPRLNRFIEKGLPEPVPEQTA